MIDSLCLTWVVRRFNAALRLRDVLPIRASMYLLSLINSNLGQGGVAWYLHRKTGVPFLQTLSSILFIALMEIYQLFLFSTLGVIFYRPTSPAQLEIVHVLRVAYVIAWLDCSRSLRFLHMRGAAIASRGWIASGRAGCDRRNFYGGAALDYAICARNQGPEFHVVRADAILRTHAVSAFRYPSPS